MKALSLFVVVCVVVVAGTAVADGGGMAMQTDFMPDNDDPINKTGNSEEDSDEMVEIDFRRYVAGGALGTVFGFGIGHAVQRRYGTDWGWLYTAGELGGLVLMRIVAGAGECKREEGENYDSCIRSRGIWALTGFMLYTGMRIAEIVTVWLPSEDRYIIVEDGMRWSEVSVLPVFNTESLGLALVTAL